VGFAIPVSIAKRIVPQLVKNGAVLRPSLSVTMRNVEDFGRQAQLPVTDGVLIWTVRAGGAGANAGLRGLSRTDDGDVELGDIITAIDGEKVANTDDVYRALDKHQIGDTVNVEVLRRGRKSTVPVRLTDAPPARRRAYGD
jgi:S1-C subfamily serine protease